MSTSAKTLVNTQSLSSSITTVYTAPSKTTTIIDKVTLTNTDSSARTASIYLVPSGQSAGSSNLVISAVSISSGATTDLSELQNQVLSAGDLISVSASVSSVVNMRVSGREVT